jgi:hypothetical protein
LEYLSIRLSQFLRDLPLIRVTWRGVTAPSHAYSEEVEMEEKARINNSLSSGMTLEQMDRLVAAWVESPEGKTQLRAIQELARKSADKVISDAKVDAEQLRQTVTL